MHGRTSFGECAGTPKPGFAQIPKAEKLMAAAAVLRPAANGRLRTISGLSGDFSLQKMISLSQVRGSARLRLSEVSLDMMDTSTSTLTTTQTTNVPDPDVIVRGNGRNFLQEISGGSHRFQADEPVSAGGGDAAPDPYDYLMASLGACTSMMVGLQARNRKWPLQNVVVSLRHSRIQARDCEECLTKDGMVDRIDVGIELTGPLTSEQRGELMRVAANCPVHRALTHETNIRLRAVSHA